MTDTEAITAANIDKTQKNTKYRLCSDRGEMIYHIISKYSELVQKEYRNRYVRVGKVINWELCKRLKFDHADKLYMHQLKSHKWMKQTDKKELESRHHWVGKAIHGESCKRLEFDHADKWYICYIIKEWFFILIIFRQLYFII